MTQINTFKVQLLQSVKFAKLCDNDENKNVILSDTSVANIQSHMKMNLQTFMRHLVLASVRINQ